MAGSSLALSEEHMALPERKLQPTLRDTIIDRMHAWLREIGAARLTATVDWEIFPFDVHDPLDEDGELMTMIAAFSSDTACETLFVIHPDRRAMSAPVLEAFAARLNARLRGIPALADLRVFDAHPESRFSIGGVPRRVPPLPSVQVLSHSLLKKPSESVTLL
jgi:hypothetical protein